MKTLITQFALTVLLVLAGTFAQAQEALGQGRPDPTGRNRYVQFGKEVTYPGATVLATLPQGVKCAPAGEMAGVPLWNATRVDHAIVSVLNPEAEVAIGGKRTFLCWCAGGFNELFLPEETDEKEEAETTTPPQKSITETAKQLTEESEDVDENMLPLDQGTAPVTSSCGNNCNSGGPNWSKRILIGTVIVGVGVGAYLATKDEGPGVDTDGSKVKCTATSYPNTCPKAPGVGASSVSQGLALGFNKQQGFHFMLSRKF